MGTAALQRTTATSCSVSAASFTFPSASQMPASRRVSRARSISTYICRPALPGSVQWQARVCCCFLYFCAFL